MKYDRNMPYNDLPFLPPRSDVETKPIMRALVTASRELAELKRIGESLPNQAVLINAIPLLEAQSSSEIENIVTTTDKLFQLASNENETTDHATKEAFRYRTALRQGYESLGNRPICTNTAITICQTILDMDITIRKTKGTKITNSVTGEIIYTPPEGEIIIRDKMSDLEKYINENSDLDPLIRMAIMHYQFEAIHPFRDGNGRTGRILNILYLVQEKLLSLPVLYLSKYIIKYKGEYYEKLRNVTEKQEWEEWIVFMLTVLESTALWTKTKIFMIRGLMYHTSHYIKKMAPKIHSKELIELIFTMPYCRIGNVTKANIAKRQTASVYLNKLVELGVLQEIKSGREKLFLHPKFMKLLTEESETIEEYK